MSHHPGVSVTKSVTFSCVGGVFVQYLVASYFEIDMTQQNVYNICCIIAIRLSLYDCVNLCWCFPSICAGVYPVFVNGLSHATITPPSGDNGEIMAILSTHLLWFFEI